MPADETLSPRAFLEDL